MALPSRDLARLDDQAFAELYEHYYDRVVRYIAARTGSRDAAEEMAGDVFVRALESLDTIQERGIPPGAWLFRVAHNLVVDHHRKRARRRGVPLEEASNVAGVSNPAEEVEHLLTMEGVYRSMVRLNPAQQEVLALRFMGGLSSEEAGAVMGRTSGAIRELQRTALKPESTEGGRRVSVLKRQEGAPVLLG